MNAIEILRWFFLDPKVNAAGIAKTLALYSKPAGENSDIIPPLTPIPHSLPLPLGIPDYLDNGHECLPPSLIPTLQKIVGTAGDARYDPLTLDLDGDGIETVAGSAGAHFDHDANGFAEQTGWVGKDDGLLVWDRNGNGKIDSGRELFGDQTLLRRPGSVLTEDRGQRPGSVLTFQHAMLVSLEFSHCPAYRHIVPCRRGNSKKAPPTSWKSSIPRRHSRMRSQAEWRSARLRLLANAGLMGRAAVKR